MNSGRKRTAAVASRTRLTNQRRRPLVAIDDAEADREASLWREVEVSRDRYADLYDFAPVGYASLDRTGCMREINLTGARLLGRPRHDLIDRPVLPLLAGPDRSAWLNHLRDLRTKARATVDLTVATRHGPPVVLRFHTVRASTPEPEPCRRPCLRAAILDVTAEHQALQAMRRKDERFRALIENAAETITILDRDGIVRYESANVTTLLGYRAEDLVGQSAFALIHPDDLPQVRHLFAETLREPNTMRHGEARVRHRDGSWRWLLFTGKNLLADPAVAGIVLNSRDITGRKRAEDALRQARDELEQRVAQRTAQLQAANDQLQREAVERQRLQAEIEQVRETERQRLGRDLHDSLGQLLTGISYLASSLQTDLARRSAPEMADMDKLVHQVQKTVHQAHELAHGLLPLELTAGGIAAALQELAAATTDCFGVRCRFSSRHAPGVLDVEMTQQLYRIAQEAVNNAVKHSRGSRIGIRLEQNHRRITLTVRDNGLGMGARKSRRTALGLHLLQYRANVLGATLRIDSARGRGTTVTCSLPAPPSGAR